MTLSILTTMSGVELEKYMSILGTHYNMTIASSSPLLYECEPVVVHDGLVF